MSDELNDGGWPLAGHAVKSGASRQRCNPSYNENYPQCLARVEAGRRDHDSRACQDITVDRCDDVARLESVINVRFYPLMESYVHRWINWFPLAIVTGADTTGSRGVVPFGSARDVSRRTSEPLDSKSLVTEEDWEST